MANERRIVRIVAAVSCLPGTAAWDNFEPREPQLDPDLVKLEPELFTGRSGSRSIMRR